jgi:hypothetical protein
MSMNKELQDLLALPTASVPDVGKICFGLSRNGSYEAAKRGDIPVVTIGRLKRVPTARLREMLGIEGA